MADNGFEIRTIDNKHNNSAFHLMADFSSERRLRLDIQLHWAGLEVDVIILDYFFMPVWPLIFLALIPFLSHLIV